MPAAAQQHANGGHTSDGRPQAQLPWIARPWSVGRFSPHRPRRGAPMFAFETSWNFRLRVTRKRMAERAHSIAQDVRLKAYHVCGLMNHPSCARGDVDLLVPKCCFGPWPTQHCLLGSSIGPRSGAAMGGPRAPECPVVLAAGAVHTRQAMCIPRVADRVRSLACRMFGANSR